MPIYKNKERSNELYMRGSCNGVRYNCRAGWFQDDDTFIPANGTKEAKEADADYRKSLKNKKNNKKIYLSHLIKEYYEQECVPNRDYPDTIKKYCEYFLNFLREEYKKSDILISKIVRLDIIKYRNKRLKMPITIRTKEGVKELNKFPKASTVNREVNSIQGMFSWSIDPAGYLEKNPCAGLEPLKIDNIPHYTISDSQEKKIFDLAKESYIFSILLFYSQTGGRMTEVLSSKWKENIHLEQTETYPFGYVHFIDTKTDEERIVPFSELLYNELRNLPVLSEYVFTNPDTGTRYKNIRKKLKSIFENVGIEGYRVGFAIFRRTFATQLKEMNIPESDIQELLGHKHLSTTQIYVDTKAKHKVEGITKMNERTKRNLSCE